MSIRQTLYMLSSTLKGVFFILIVLCILVIVVYTKTLVDDLRRETRDIVEFYAITIQRIASDPLESEALGWFFENITQRTNFPLVLTDSQGHPNTWKDIGLPEQDRSPEALKQVRNIMDKMSRENKPVEITYEDQIINYLYYGDSRLILQLVYLPYITLSGLGLLVLIAFLGFSSIKKSEQRFIWVGMAKETAHQLGTPISSLLGWLEIMKSDTMTPKKLETITHDVESDVKRLEKVAARFSQIGSRAHLKEQDIHPILNDVIVYFRRRLPQSGKEIKILAKPGQISRVMLNRELFEWAVENLIKNAIDAIKGVNGLIEIITGLDAESNRPFIEIRDNGAGIKAKKRADVFKAGYSTKKRGWGLGLNFAKRIIEDYHRGKIFVKESQPGKGTTMRVEL